MHPPNVYLRKAAPTDEDRIHELLCVPEVFEYLADDEAPSRTITSEWILSAASDSDNYPGGLWLLVIENENECAGVVKLAGDETKELELTYILDPRVWGRGYATRMAHSIMIHAFEEGRTAQIWAGADLPNTRSFGVMKRLGMQFRRKVEYPMGAGMEFEITSKQFDPFRFEPLPIR